MKQIDGLHPNISIRLFHGEKCFGPGIASLLLLVKELHSLRSAAMRMDMAYSKAWKIVRQCEERLGFPLLASSVGGKGGGGAVLTREGEALLDAYQRYCQAVQAYSQEIFPAYFSPSAQPVQEEDK